MAVRHFRDLIAWQKSMDLVESIYRSTERFPSNEMFGLTNQLRRAAVSIPSNIAEGQGRESTKDFLHFLSISRGSLQEVQTKSKSPGDSNTSTSRRFSDSTNRPTKSPAF